MLREEAKITTGNCYGSRRLKQPLGQPATCSLQYVVCQGPDESGVHPVSLRHRMVCAAPGFVEELLGASKPVKLFTLAIVNKNGRVLLGLKKTGFGQGYYNGFGGKVEPGETIEQAAQRELHEEAGIHASSLHHRGILTFVFDDQQLPWEVHVYHVPDYTGEPTESEEMAPVWMTHAEIPYDRMWADDIYWYPILLRGAAFQGLFAFENTHKLVWHNLIEVQELGMPATELLQ